MIAKYLDMRGRIGRKTFWTGWALHLVLSIGLAVTWNAASKVLGNLAWAIVPVLMLRVALIGPQMSLYVRRLHDIGLSGRWVFVLIGIYTFAALAGAFLAHIASESWGECQQGSYDACDDNAFFGSLAVMAGYGPLTGLPGPFSLLCAVIVGLKARRPKAPGAGPGA